MAYNRNFYNNFYGGNFTFQNQYPNRLPVPPPPPVSPFPFAQKPPLSDQEFIKKFEQRLNNTPTPNHRPNSISIRDLRENLYTLTSNLKQIEEKQKELQDNMEKYTEDQWNAEINIISTQKATIDKLISQFSGPYMDLARKCLAKRTAKRLRLKRLREERKTQKEERLRESKERSRKIDENLQKIKNDILKAKQEEEAKLEADMVLKDVHRKKIDAKKCLVKLDALLKLRQARQNTAKGRGQTFSEHEASLFETNIEKLKVLWTQRLAMYDKEEISLRARLETTDKSIGQDEKEIDNNLKSWKKVLFGGANPQVDFNGDIDKFVAVRREWDRYIDDEGTSLPIGWVVTMK